MNAAESPVMDQPIAETRRSVLQLPMGLLGFEDVKSYLLLGSPEEAPFLWLQMEGDPNLAFLVVSPADVMDFYEPDISEEEVEFLGLESADDALLLNIVTLHGDGSATVNLKGPIVVNRHSRVGKQVVPRNAGSYSLKHPLNAATH